MDYLRSNEWWSAAATRAIKTGAQTFLAMWSAGGIGIAEIDWLTTGSVVCFSMLYSIVTSLAGLPEVKESNEQSGKHAKG